MKNKIYLSALMFIAIALFGGCAKDGATGPQGPPGNANVTAVTFIVNSWLVDNNNTYYYASFNLPELTSIGNSSGAIEVFHSIDGGATWNAIPFTQVNSPYNYYMSFITQTNLVEVDWVHDGGTLGIDPNSFYSISSSEFKVVIIPPSMMKSNVDLRNYGEVKAAYNLKD